MSINDIASFLLMICIQCGTFNCVTHFWMVFFSVCLPVHIESLFLFIILKWNEKKRTDKTSLKSCQLSIDKITIKVLKSIGKILLNCLKSIVAWECREVRGGGGVREDDWYVFRMFSIGNKNSFLIISVTQKIYRKTRNWHHKTKTTQCYTKCECIQMNFNMKKKIRQHDYFQCI